MYIYDFDPNDVWYVGQVKPNWWSRWRTITEPHQDYTVVQFLVSDYARRLASKRKLIKTG